jgi:hypothetical protein
MTTRYGIVRRKMRKQQSCMNKESYNLSPKRLARNAPLISSTWKVSSSLETNFQPPSACSQTSYFSIFPGFGATKPIDRSLFRISYMDESNPATGYLAAAQYVTGVLTVEWQSLR